MAVKYNLEVTETGVNHDNNYSTISVKLQFTTTGQSHNNYGSDYPNSYPSGTITIDGTSYSIGSKLPYTTTVTVYNNSHTIYHNSDGTRSVTVSFSFNTHISAGTMTGSKTIQLTNIVVDKVNQCSISSDWVEVGSTVTIYTNRAKDTYTHRVWYSFNGTDGFSAGLSATSGIGGSCTFTPPADLINYMSSTATSGTATFAVAVYKDNGATHLGTTYVSTNVYMTPAKYPPSMGGISTSVYSNGSPFSDIYVRNYSGVKLNYSGSAQRGAYVSYYAISGDGLYTTTGSTEYIRNKMANSGNVTFTVTVYDSRGASASRSVTIWVDNYYYPSISSVGSVRCNSSGSPDNTGSYFKATAYGSYTNIGANVNGNISIKVQYMITGGSSYNSGNWLDVSKNSGGATGSKVIGGSLKDATYKVLYTIYDAYGHTSTYEDILSGHFFTLDINSGGTSVGIGSSASDNQKILTIGMSEIVLSANPSLSGNLRLTDGTVLTSDERVKKDFKTLEEYENFFLDLKPVAFKFLTGTSDRYHIGFKAQDVKKSLDSNNLTTQDFAGYAEYPTNKNYYLETLGYDPIKSEIECGLGYTEFIGLAVHMIQKQHKEIKELKSRIAALERSDN